MDEHASRVNVLLRQQAAIARFGSFALRQSDLLAVPPVHEQGREYPARTGTPSFAPVPPSDGYPIDVAEGIVDPTGSLLEADRGSQCRAETQAFSR